MTKVQFYGSGLAGSTDQSYPGKLIIVEGPDGVGRSTQIALLREWLEANGYAVSSSGFKRSELAAQGIAQAKLGHTLGHITSALFYAADFADRLERELVPALRAGFVVLNDRYLYSMIARSIVRGVDPDWVRSLMGFALVPDAIFYLQTDVKSLLPRVLSSRSFDYWESGMDFMGRPDYYESFVAYQEKMLAVLDQLSNEFSFDVIDATRPVEDVFAELKTKVGAMVSELKPQTVSTGQA